MKLLATILAFLAVVDATPVKRPAFRAGPSIMGPAFTPGTLPGPAPLPDIEARSTPAMTPAKRIASLAKACKDLKLDGYHLQGKCSEDGKGDPVEVKIDLNSRISNDKGMLKFKLKYVSLLSTSTLLVVFFGFISWTNAIYYLQWRLRRVLREVRDEH